MNSSLTLWEGCKLSLLKAKHDFMAGVDFVNEVISDANSRFSSDDEKSKREFLIESAFLRMFIYWESFIEKTFVCYLTKNLGDDFDVDSCPQSYAQAIDEIHANSLLIGQGSFVNWSKSDSVSKLAKAFFYEGAPYQTSLSSINSTLSHLSKIRNNTGLAPIFPDTFYRLTHYWFAAADIPVANDIPVHCADAIRCNVRRPPQGSLPLLTRQVLA